MNRQLRFAYDLVEPLWVAPSPPKMLEAMAEARAALLKETSPDA